MTERGEGLEVRKKKEEREIKNSPQNLKMEKVLVAFAELAVAMGIGLGLGTRSSVVNMKNQEILNWKLEK